MKHPAIFLDRDGTLMEEVHYCSDPAKVRLFPGVGEALRLWSEAGYRLVIITNQSGVGRGYFTQEAYEAVHRELLIRLGEVQAPAIDGTWVCFDVHSTARRKPEPGMVLEAAEALGIDLARSWMIGDKPSDIQCGQRAGTRTLLVTTGYGAETVQNGVVSPDLCADTLLDAARKILAFSS